MPGTAVIFLTELVRDRQVRLLLSNQSRFSASETWPVVVFPQIRKYHRSLIEVLLLHWFFNINWQLVMQQIFDKVIGQQNLDTFALGLLLLLVSLSGCYYVRTYLFADNQ